MYDQCEDRGGYREDINNRAEHEAANNMVSIFGRCLIHKCDLVLKEVKEYPGKTVPVCPECQKERMKFYSEMRKPDVTD